MFLGYEAERLRLQNQNIENESVPKIDMDIKSVILIVKLFYSRGGNLRLSIVAIILSNLCSALLTRFINLDAILIASAYGTENINDLLHLDRELEKNPRNLNIWTTPSIFFHSSIAKFSRLSCSPSKNDARIEKTVKIMSVIINYEWNLARNLDDIILRRYRSDEHVFPRLLHRTRLYVDEYISRYLSDRQR